MYPLAKTLAAAFLFLYLQNPSFSQAEKIICKDGKIYEGTIINRTKGSVWISHDLGSIGISLDDIENILDDDGSVSKFDLKALNDSIVSCIQKKQYGRALMLSNKLLEWFPDDNRIHLLRAGLNQMLGNFKEAIVEYDYLILNEAADAKVYNDLGSIYAKLGNEEKALELFTRATQENPDLIQAHNNLAELFMRSKDYSRAIEEYNTVLSSEPRNEKVLYNLGVAYMDSGDYEKAREQWEKLLSIDPNDEETKKAIDYVALKGSESKKPENPERGNKGE